MKILDQILQVTELSEFQISEMLQLMQENYDNLTADKFRSDLMKKDGVLMLTTDKNCICGFSTYKLIETTIDGKKYYAIFSGDTIIQKEYWGQFALFRCFAKLINFFLTLGRQPLCWFLITKGIRTYLMLPLFFRAFYPTFIQETPGHFKKLTDQFGKQLFREFYDSKSSIVRIIPPSDHLKPHLAEIPDGKITNPHIQFFLQENPGFTRGDELCCIAEISPENFTSATLKFIKKA